MAITEVREVLIEASPDAVMSVLLDLESLPEWSSAHKEIEILERDAEGRPSKARQVVKIVGVSDEQVLEYHFDGPVVSWTLISSSQQRAQEGRYTLTPQGDSSTQVRFELTVDLVAPLPGFLVKKGANGLMDTATKGLRTRTLDKQRG